MMLKKTNLILIALIVLVPFIAIETQAINYSVSIVQNPIKVYAGETIVITATVNDMVRDEEIISARLSHKIAGSVQTSFDCEETLPQLENIVTFLLGPFEADEQIMYKIYLEFQLAGSYDYFSEWYSFTVKGGSPRVLTNLQIMYICIAAAVVIVVTIPIIIVRKRR